MKITPGLIEYHARRAHALRLAEFHARIGALFGWLHARRPRRHGLA